MTQGLEDQMKDRDYFYKKAKRTGNNDDWNIAKYLRNKVKRDVRSAKADYIKNKLNTHADDAAKFWRTIKSVFPIKQLKRTSQIKLVDDQKKQIPDSKIPDFINKFFINIGNPLGTHRGTPGLKQPAPAELDTNLELDPIMSKKVDTLIKQINTSKSSGMKDLKTSLIKDALLGLTEQMTHIINTSIETSTFPKLLKEATVVPIPKAGDPREVNNYRPISLLPIPGKLIEKVIHMQIDQFLEDQGTLADTQYGFRKNRSTTHAISELTDDINNNLNNGKKTAAIFIDFKKAFDCVQHDILINKLRDIGFNESALSWTADYLQERKQRVKVNGSLSDFETVKQGVPQGSILGPLLYIIYANDIQATVKKCKITLYADDTVIYSSSKSAKKALAKVQKDVDNLIEWCDRNAIFINPKKTKYMIFSNRRVHPEKYNNWAGIKIGGEDILLTTSYTYLGVTLDDQLKYDLHIKKTINQISAKVLQLKKIRQFITTKAALLIYKKHDPADSRIRGYLPNLCKNRPKKEITDSAK